MKEVAMKSIKSYNELINSELLMREVEFVQHGDFSVYDHSLYVAKTCVSIARKFNMDVDYESLVKGALLHDYFLYDWHDASYDRSGLHGFRHPKVARDNASRDFSLNKKEENMILSHMFPLGISLPRYKESIILCLVDKYCATRETISGIKIFKKIFNYITCFYRN